MKKYIKVLWGLLIATTLLITLSEGENIVIKQGIATRLEEGQYKIVKIYKDDKEIKQDIIGFEIVGDRIVKNNYTIILKRVDK